MLRNVFLAAVLTAGLLSSASAATQQYHATLNGKNEVPPTSSTGTGTLAASLDTTTKTLSYTLTFDGLSGPAAAAHFHGPAKTGASAPVVVPIGGANPTSPVTGTATLTDDQIKDLRSRLWYVNVHTAANKGGEIRGQVLRGPLPKSKSTAATKPKQS
jgi:hypothetical protein